MNPILEKIKKLLRMRHGGTPAEVETALALAADLARKHGIDLVNVDPNEETQESVLNHRDKWLGSRIQWECKYAALVVQTFFNVTFLLRTMGSISRSGWRHQYQYAITFIGTATDLEVAQYVYHFLVGHFRRTWNHASGRLRNRQAFLYGMYHGICEKLDNAQPKTAPQPGLVAVDRALDRRREYMDRNFGKTEDKSCKPDGDAMAAKLAGLPRRKTHQHPARTGRKSSNETND